MTSAIGWMNISPAALRKMQHAAEGGADGVVDELGLLALHSGYADKFFPGTWVLETRARYLFFVPWTYLALASTGRVSVVNVRAAKEAKEIQTTRLLKDAGAEGVIGGRVHPRPPAQPPDFAYWTALDRFGLYEGRSGPVPAPVAVGSEARRSARGDPRARRGAKGRSAGNIRRASAAGRLAKLRRRELVRANKGRGAASPGSVPFRRCHAHVHGGGCAPRPDAPTSEGPPMGQSLADKRRGRLGLSAGTRARARGSVSCAGRARYICGAGRRPS